MSAKHFDEKGNEFNCPHDQVISDINGSLLSISKTLAGFNNRLTETYNRLFVDPEKGDCISTAVKKIRNI